MCRMWDILKASMLSLIMKQHRDTCVIPWGCSVDVFGMTWEHNKDDLVTQRIVNTLGTLLGCIGAIIGTRGHSSTMWAKFYSNGQLWIFYMIPNLCLVAKCGISTDPLASYSCPHSHWMITYLGTSSNTCISYGMDIFGCHENILQMPWGYFGDT